MSKSTRSDPKPTKAAALPKATTLRLEPSVQEGLTLVQGFLNRPMNRLVNDAVRAFIAEQTGRIESDMKQSLERLRAYRRRDPQFKRAIDAFAEAEVLHGSSDPVEGRVVTKPRPGPSQKLVRELLRG